MEDLIQLEAGRKTIPAQIPKEVTAMVTPLRWKDWEDCLALHPDRRFAGYITEGIRQGFRIGFKYATHRCKKAKRNMRSAEEHPEVVRKYLANECVEGRVLGPFNPLSLPEVHTSRFGVIPKSSGGWRLILDLSSPEGSSVNDGIAEDLCSLSYISLEDAARGVMSHGPGCLLSKVDIKQAYRMVPVHPEDRLLLGMVWDDGLFVDTALPFGLRSAPKIFTAMADALEWIALQEGVGTILHYLDDYLLIAPPNSNKGSEDLNLLLAVFERLRVPVAVEKLEGPACCITFLGIEIDTVAMVLRLPRTKLVELKSLVNEWMEKRSCVKRELQSLAGKLQHACKVVRPGRTFLRRMFELLRGVAKKRHFVRLNAAFRSDLRWWQLFLENWNGVSMLENLSAREPDQHVFSDAAGSFGCGAIWGVSWFQFQWPEAYGHHSIAVKELLPIVMACAVWGKQWRKQAVLAHCDNKAVVDVINAGCCRDSHLMHLLRSLFFITAHYEIAIRAVHLAGRDNSEADAISRDKMSFFHSQAPEANQLPASLPPPLVDLLVVKCPDWTSPSWSQLFSTYLKQV